MDKIIKYNNLSSDIKKINPNGKIVLAGGCFDILHPGHIAFLEAAKKQGGNLIILLESDASVKARKGEKRPINNQEKRANLLSNIEFVDYIVLLPKLKTNNDYYKLTKIIKPDIIAITKNDPFLAEKMKQAEMVNGKVVEVIDRIQNYSTTKILNENLLN